MLDPCVRTILCSLGAVGAAGILAVVDTVEAGFLSELDRLRGQLALLRLTQLPSAAVLATAEQLNAAITNIVEPFFQLVPFGLIRRCGDFGRVTDGVRTVTGDAQAEMNEFLQTLARQLSVADELDARILEIQDFLDIFQEIRDLLRECP